MALQRELQTDFVPLHTCIILVKYYVQYFAMLIIQEPPNLVQIGLIKLALPWLNLTCFLTVEFQFMVFAQKTE